jgi:drug/metabolite transporter (DMT)-like permease
MFWIFLTIFGALMNNVRLALQKNLNNKLCVETVAWARYSFGIPLAFAYFLFAKNCVPEFPQINANFLFYCLIGGVFQIFGTIVLVNLLRRQNFAVGFTYSKTEALQTALIGMIFFGEVVSLIAILSIIIGIVGILIISVSRQEGLASNLFMKFASKSVLLGIVSGLLFSISGLSIRSASLALGDSSLMAKTSLLLMVLILIQFMILGLWIFFKKRNEFIKLIVNWKIAFLIGLTSFLGSVGLVSALSLKEATYVKAVTQIGIIFSILISYIFFKEKITKLEMVGMLILTSAIVIISYFG